MRRFLASVRCAIAGLRVLVGYGANARIHAAVTVVVVALGAWLRLDALRWAAVALAVAGVWAAEALNTALELVARELWREPSPAARQALDVAAAAVLVAAAGAALAGACAILPALLARLGSLAAGGSP